MTIVPVPTGRRDRRIWFYRRTVASRTTLRDINGYTWTKLAGRWAHVKSGRGGERELAGQVVEANEIQVVFPYLSGLTTNDAVVFGDDPGATTDAVEWGIEAIEDREQAGFEMIATLKKVVG